MQKDVSASPDARLYFFCYDWRRDPNENASKLLLLLRGMKSPPQIIAHSMGAQLSWHVVNREPHLAYSVILAGGPFKGNFSFMRDMVKGGKTVLYKQSPDVLFTYPSPFCFMPLEKDAKLILEDDSEGNWDPTQGEKM